MKNKNKLFIRNLLQKSVKFFCEKLKIEIKKKFCVKKKNFTEKEEKKFHIWKMTEVMATTQTNNNKNKYR